MPLSIRNRKFTENLFFAHQFSLVIMYLRCDPRQLFFQCGPETPKGWTPPILDAEDLNRDFSYCSTQRRRNLELKSSQVNCIIEQISLFRRTKQNPGSLQNIIYNAQYHHICDVTKHANMQENMTLGFLLTPHEGFFFPQHP